LYRQFPYYLYYKEAEWKFASLKTLQSGIYDKLLVANFANCKVRDNKKAGNNVPAFSFDYAAC